MDGLLWRFLKWWRGYGEADVASLTAKFAAPYRPGECFYLTPREWNAYRNTDLKDWHPAFKRGLQA